MIIVRVELMSAITGQTRELARMHICNEGGTNARCDYGAYVLRGRDKEALDRSWRAGTYTETAKVTGHARLQEHVWNLVSKALVAAGYKVA